jgi:futalosine hydrolase
MTSWLLLVPTAVELQCLPSQFLSFVERSGGAIELCGFGPVVAAARAASLIASHQPRHVVLCGIAGAMGPQLTVATAYNFGSVACYGIGVGSADAHQSASSVGWRQWPGDTSGLGLGVPIADLIELTNGQNDMEGQKMLLTACAASQNESDVAMKLAAWPLALAEDMEGFAVAAACQLAGVPLRIVRGISNRAGDREHRNWRVEEAMIAASKLVEAMVGS